MVKRPLEDVRPVGPLLNDEDSESYVKSELDGDGDSDSDDHKSAIIEQAENWYESVSDEKTKKKMMIEYIDGITDDDVPRSRAVRMVEESGL